MTGRSRWLARLAMLVALIYGGLSHNPSTLTTETYSYGRMCFRQLFPCRVFTRRFARKLRLLRRGVNAVLCFGRKWRDWSVHKMVVLNTARNRGKMNTDFVIGFYVSLSIYGK